MGVDLSSQFTTCLAEYGGPDLIDVFAIILVGEPLFP